MYLLAIYVIASGISPNLGKLNGNICGRAFGELTPESKIVGGYDVGYYRYPWYAALMVDKIVACGGSLVGSKTVVSAAHCFKEYITGSNAQKTKLEDVYNVTLGIYNRCQKEKTQKMFYVHKVYIHEKYKDNIPYYDISLLILEGNTNPYQPICLPKKPLKRPRVGSVPGLGTLRYQGSVPCTLHEAQLLIYPDQDCRNMINRTGNDPKKLFKAFCAGYLQGGIDTCQGDSGGPFQVLDGSQNHMLLGVVSFGFHCANPNLLGVYTDVSQYIDWIEHKAGFHATLEDGNSTSSGQETEPLPEPSQTTAAQTRPTQKPTSKPHSSRPFLPALFQETIVRPLNIIIFKNHKGKEERKSANSQKKLQTKNKKAQRKNKKQIG